MSGTIVKSSGFFFFLSYCALLCKGCQSPGGTFISGRCVCNDSYTGENCDVSLYTQQTTVPYSFSGSGSGDDNYTNNSVDRTETIITLTEQEEGSSTLSTRAASINKNFTFGLPVVTDSSINGIFATASSPTTGTPLNDSDTGILIPFTSPLSSRKERETQTSSTVTKAAFETFDTTFVVKTEPLSSSQENVTNYDRKGFTKSQTAFPKTFPLSTQHSVIPNSTVKSFTTVSMLTSIASGASASYNLSIETDATTPSFLDRFTRSVSTRETTTENTILPGTSPSAVFTAEESSQTEITHSGSSQDPFTSENVASATAYPYARTSVNTASSSVPTARNRVSQPVPNTTRTRSTSPFHTDSTALQTNPDTTGFALASATPSGGSFSTATSPVMSALVFDVVIRLNSTFLLEYDNLQSRKTGRFVRNFVQQIGNLMAGTAFIKMTVRKIRPGSIIMETEMHFQRSEGFDNVNANILLQSRLFQTPDVPVMSVFAEDANECARPGVCGPNATCFNLIGSFKCDCKLGFVEAKESSLRFNKSCRSVCDDVVCFNGGICVVGLEFETLCSCQNGYFGAHCEQSQIPWKELSLSLSSILGLVLLISFAFLICSIHRRKKMDKQTFHLPMVTTYKSTSNEMPVKNLSNPFYFEDEINSVGHVRFPISKELAMNEDERYMKTTSTFKPLEEQEHRL